MGGLAWVPWLLIICGSLVVGLVGWRSLSGGYPIRCRWRWPWLLSCGWVFPNLVPRPVLFSLVLLALFMVVLEVRAGVAAPLDPVGVGRRARILCTGSWHYWCSTLCADAWHGRRRPAESGSAIIAVSLTAHGLGVWSMLASFLTNRGALDFISEWAAPDLLSWPSLRMSWSWLPSWLLRRSGRIEVRELWVVAPLLVFGLTSARAIMPAAIVLGPVCGFGVAPRHRPSGRWPAVRPAPTWSLPRS